MPVSFRTREEDTNRETSRNPIQTKALGQSYHICSFVVDAFVLFHQRGMAAALLKAALWLPNLLRCPALSAHSVPGSEEWRPRTARTLSRHDLDRAVGPRYPKWPPSVRCAAGCPRKVSPDYHYHWRTPPQ